MSVLFRHRYTIVLALAIATFCWLGATRYLGAGRDDVFITLYAGQALADGQGIVNYNGDRVEMSSSLSHTLIIAAIDLIAPNFVFTLNKIVGGLCGVLTLVALYFGRGVMFRVGRWRFPTYALTLSLTATNPAFLYWSFGGLETPFAGLFLTCYAVSLLHHRFKQTPFADTAVIGAQCLYILTRPEGFYLILFTAVYLALMKIIARRPLRLRILLIPIAFLATLTAFRWMYFGALLPNTVYAKSGGIREGVANGFVYFTNFYDASLLLLCAFAIQCVLFIVYTRYLAKAFHSLPRRTPLPLANILLFGLVLAAQLVVLFSGGDWMEHFRFFAPIMPLLIVLTIGAVARCIEQYSLAANAPRTAAIALVGFGVAAFAVNLRQSDINIPRPLPRENVSSALPYSLRDILSAGANLDQAIMELNAGAGRDQRLLIPFFRDVLPDLHNRSGGLVVATGQMGFFPYWLKRMHPDYTVEFVDTLGLCDRTVAQMPLSKDHTGVADGRFVDEVLDGQVPLLSDYLKSRSPNLVYFLGYDPEVERRLQMYAQHGFHPVQKKVGAMVLYKNEDGA